MITENKIKLAIERGMTYDTITGNIYGPSGKLITFKSKKGYIEPGVWFENKSYRFRGHIFAWYYTYGKMPDNQIDHINGVKDDNRIINLRDVTNQQNCFNRKNIKGVTQRPNGKWRARIGLNGKKISLGDFDIEEEAKQAYLDAKKIYHIIEYDL